ncbi:MAG: hypothetical protein AAGF59_03015 [Pseudomonadota bacterium]
MNAANTDNHAVESLKLTCEAIAKGQFEDVDRLFDIVAGEAVPDDIRALAESFAAMVVQIEAREFHANQLISDLQETQRQLETARKQLEHENSTLKKRLKKIDVTYDESKALQEVSEIEESDYFQDLRQRASDLRARYKKP